MERGVIGTHTAAAKERFLLCLDNAVPRHAELPADYPLPSGQSRWTWLPLTAQQAGHFGWSALLDSPEAAAKMDAARVSHDGDVEPLVSPPTSDGFVGPSEGYHVWNLIDFFKG